MDQQLTDEELEREQNLFAPREIKYKRLAGKRFDIRAFAEQVSEDKEDEDMTLPPASC